MNILYQTGREADDCHGKTTRGSWIRGYEHASLPAGRSVIIITPERCQMPRTFSSGTYGGMSRDKYTLGVNLIFHNYDVLATENIPYFAG